VGTNAVVPGKRNWEMEMLGEWLAARHPGARVMTHVRLGPDAGGSLHPGLSPEERRLLGASFRRWADAVVVDGGQLLVVETAMVPSPGDISLVDTYLLLVDVTPELQELRPLPRRGVLVWAVDDPYSRQVAIKNGLSVELFKPSNFLEWLSTKRAREQRSPRTGLAVSQEIPETPEPSAPL